MGDLGVEGMGRRWVAGIATMAAAGLVALVAVLVVSASGSQAQPTVAESCEAIHTASAVRRAEVSGSGPTVAVIGDSYSQGLGLADPRQSWPSRLPGTVIVDGFAGSGFSDAASPCPREAYYHRVARALAADPGLVVLQGGLNEYDVPGTEIRHGLDRVLRDLAGREVVMVGPPTAPRREGAIARIDDLLAVVAQRHDVPYVRTSGWQLDYLPDRLHLTVSGHAAFGDGVAAALEALVDAGDAVTS